MIMNDIFKKNMLILGDGFIGNNLYRYFSNKYNTSISNKKDMDITNVHSIKSYLHNKHFDYIISAVGIKNIKECEKYPDIAYSINADGIKNILNYLDSSSKIIYISTDYVFDGTDGGYSESSVCNPITAYGKSKLLGEDYTLKHNNSIVVRASGVYGKCCFWLNDLIKSLSEKQNIVCFSDIYNSPTYAINLAEMIDDIINTDFLGIINLSGDTRSNRYDLYESVATIFERDITLLSKGLSNGYFPKDISLNNGLYRSLIKKTPDTTINGLIRFKNEY